MVLLAFILMILLGFAGLAIDGSNLYLQQQRMQIAADAAALGGARILASNGDDAAVGAEVRSLAFTNGADRFSWEPVGSRHGVLVTAESNFPAHFLVLFGYETLTVSAEAEARFETVTRVGELFPITFSCSCWSDSETIRVEAPTPTPTPTPITTPTPTPTPVCTGTACLVSSPRLLSVNTSESALLNPLLQGLLGVNLNVNVVDWNGLANFQVTVGQLQTALGIATPSQLLSTPISLAQLFNAMNASLPGGLPGSLRSAIVMLPVGTIRLGDLLDIDDNLTAYSDINLNALDLVTGAIQLFNHRNVVNATVAVGIPVNGVVNNGLLLRVKVIEPPVFVCGGVGTTFHSAAIRIGLSVDIPELSRHIELLAARVTIEVNHLDLYVEVASGTGMLSALDAVAKTVTVQARPSIANLYVGTLSNTRFFNAAPINPATDLQHSMIGKVYVKVILVPAISANLGLKLSAQGTAATPQTLFFSGFGSGSYPETKTATAGASSLSTLLSTLVGSVSAPGAIQANLDVGSLGLSLGTILNGVLNLLSPLLSSTGGILFNVLSNVIAVILDPLLNLLGVGLGQMDVTVIGVVTECTTPTIDPGGSGGSGGGEAGGEAGGGGDDENSCTFQWVDWNGVTTSQMEIQTFINDLSQSRVLALTTPLAPGPAVQYNSAINTAINARYGEVLRVPMTEVGSGGNGICGFANVQLVDHDLTEGWIELRFITRLIRGQESNRAVNDYGVRDVRLTR